MGGSIPKNTYHSEPVYLNELSLSNMWTEYWLLIARFLLFTSIKITFSYFVIALFPRDLLPNLDSLTQKLWVKSKTRFIDPLIPTDSGCNLLILIQIFDFSRRFFSKMLIGFTLSSLDLLVLQINSGAHLKDLNPVIVFVY